MYEEFIEALQDLHDGGAGAFLLDDLLGEGEDEDDDGETSHGGPTRSKKSGKSGYSQVPQDDPWPWRWNWWWTTSSWTDYETYVVFNRLLHFQDFAWLATAEWSCAQWRGMVVNLGQHQQLAEL